MNGMGAGSDTEHGERELDATINRLLWPAVLLCAIASGSVLAFITSCAAAKPGAEAAYLAENLQCIDQAETRAEAVSCRERVRARWATDAGTDASDGGIQ